MPDSTLEDALIKLIPDHALHLAADFTGEAAAREHPSASGAKRLLSPVTVPKTFLPRPLWQTVVSPNLCPAGGADDDLLTGGKRLSKVSWPIPFAGSSGWCRDR